VTFSPVPAPADMLRTTPRLSPFLSSLGPCFVQPFPSTVMLRASISVQGLCPSSIRALLFRSPESPPLSLLFYLHVLLRCCGVLWSHSGVLCAIRSYEGRWHVFGYLARRSGYIQEPAIHPLARLSMSFILLCSQLGSPTVSQSLPPLISFAPLML
jgi:hypothetical protein